MERHSARLGYIESVEIDDNVKTLTFAPTGLWWDGRWAQGQSVKVKTPNDLKVGDTAYVLYHVDGVGKLNKEDNTRVDGQWCIDGVYSSGSGAVETAKNLQSAVPFGTFLHEVNNRQYYIYTTRIKGQYELETIVAV